MRRPILKQSGDGPGQDSFLDILANIVGILIILVMVVGVRVKNEPVELQQADEAVQAELAGLAEDRAAAISVRTDVLKIEREIADVDREAHLRDRERVRLATAVAAVNQTLQEHRQRLDTDSQKAFDLERDLSESRADLALIQQRRQQVQQVDTEPTVVKTYPTPLSRPVDNHEAHFLLSDGLVVFVPMQELLAEFKVDARAKVGNLRRMDQLTETIGPVGGFRLKYTLHRREVLLEPGRRSSAVGTYASLKHLVLLPTHSEMGETLEVALADGSDFQRHLARFHPARSTVTVWTYPDSFREFRLLKKELYTLGYETAGRPLPFGVPITASPDGSKSAAE